MRISDSIIKLLIEDNEATVGGFGVFKTEMINASIHPITKDVTPPNKKIVFFHNVQATSFRFDQVFAAENNLQIEDAVNHIKDIVKQFNDNLSEFRKVDIVGFASLKMNLDDLFDVITEENIIFDKDFFALPSFQINSNPKADNMEENIHSSASQEDVKPIIPIVVPSQTPPIIIDPVDDKPIEEEKPPKKKNSWIWILILLLLIGGIGVAGFIFKDKIIDIYNNHFSKVEVEQKETVVAETPEVIEEFVDTTSQEVIDTIAIEPVKPEVVIPVKTNKGNSSNYVKPVDLSKIVYAPKGAAKYYVIAGSFKIIDNAATLVAQLMKKGYDPVVIEKNEQGLIRVAYKPGFDTERLARNFADDLYENKNLLPWIVQF